MSEEKTGEDWGTDTDLGVLERLVPIEGRRLIDVGCGAGDLARALAERGATVTGVEPDPAQAAANRMSAPTAGVTLLEGRAQHLPVADGSCDGVIFGKSLHHIPQADMKPALVEARRAVTAETGFVYVLEPVMSGAFSGLIKPFHDETAVRRQAIEALSGLVPELFHHERVITYTTITRFESHAAFVERFAAMTYNDYARDAIRSDVVRARFEAGRTAEADYAFAQPMRVNLLLAGGGNGISTSS